MINLPNLETQQELVEILRSLNKTLAYSSNESFTRNILLKQGSDKVLNPGSITIPSGSTVDLLSITGKGRFIAFIPKMSNSSSHLKLEAIIDGESVEIYNKASTYGTNNEVWAFDSSLVYRYNSSLIVNHMNMTIPISSTVERETLIEDASFNNSLIIRATATSGSITLEPIIIYSIVEGGE